MALVNFLRFNDDCGAGVADEEFWNVFFRRRLCCDSLHSLLDGKTAQACGMEVVYGGSGYPSFHREVVRETRKAIAARMAQAEKQEAEPPATVREIARMAFDELRKQIRRRIDQKLRFFYGVDTEDVNRSSLSRKGETFPIKQGKVMDALRAVSSGDSKDMLLKFIFDSKAVVFGFDQQVGMTSYHLSPDKYICGYVHEGFECIGPGKYASGLSLGRDFRTRTLMMRKAGYEPAEGLFELLSSALIAKDHFKEVGGNMNMVLFDRRGKKREDRFREVVDGSARLAGEIIKAHLAGLLGKDQAIDLLDSLVYGRVDFKTVEKKLVDKAGGPDGLMLVLRGYKLREIPELLAAGSGKPGNRSGAQRKGGRR